MQNQQGLEEPQATALYAPQTTTRDISEAKVEQRRKQMEAAQFENALVIARAEAKAYRKKRCASRTTLYLMGGLFSLMTLFWLYGVISGRNPADWSNFIIYSSLFTSFGGVALSQSHKEATKILAQFNDVRAVGLLAETLESGDKDLTRVSRDALTNLLPRLQFSDAALLSAAQRDILSRALPKVVKKEDRALSLAILKAYEQVGGEREAAAVERLAGSSVAAYDSALREAAIDCLPALRDSIARRRESAVLLRASQAGEVQPETLLRPAAYAANQNDAQELLRSSQTEA